MEAESELFGWSALSASIVMTSTRRIRCVPFSCVGQIRHGNRGPSPTDSKPHLFGAPDFRLNGVAVTGLSVKTQAILFYLAVTRQTYLRVVLADLLWGDIPESSARANLRKSVQQLRSALPAHVYVD